MGGAGRALPRQPKSAGTGALQYSSIWVNIPQMPLDDVLIALADDTRRQILHRLTEEEARVTEVAARFDISLNSVSKHIRMLERAGLVRRRVVGRDHYLSFEPRALDDVTDWLERHRKVWHQRLDALEAALRAEDTLHNARSRK